jgi:flagellar hook-associated protein 1 FlgK
VRDELVPSLKEDLDYTAYQMAQEVNKLHEEGMGLDGSSGIPFFQNPADHFSQGYASRTEEYFNTGPDDVTIGLKIDGDDHSFDLDAGSYSLEDLRDEINGALGSPDPPFASIREDNSGQHVLVLAPEYDSSNNSAASVEIDMSGLDAVAGQSTPKFSKPNFADLMTMAVKDPSKVAAGETSAPGDNRMALEIAALKDKHAVNGEDTFVSFYGKMAARVGIEASQNRLEQSGAQDSLTQLKNMRDGAAGVSLEEEMIALVKYQRGFEASAKLLSTVDDMMGTVISIKR